MAPVNALWMLEYIADKQGYFQVIGLQLFPRIDRIII